MMTKLRFEDLNLSNEVLNAVKDMGFEETSPIQAEAIPLIIEGKDIIGQAQTGTGKTAAFAIPVIEKIDTENKKLQAVILCPTRELVIQVSEEFRKLTKYKENLLVVPVYGGQEIDRQLKALKKGAQIVIGTPGRTMDHMNRGSIKMHSVHTIVLDEADEMLDMGFREDMEIILKDTPQTRQTIMFSATMANDIIDLTKNYQTDPVIVNVTHKKLSTPKIHQKYVEVLEKNKPEVLSRLIEIHHIKLALVFCNTKNQVDQLVEILKTRGYFADALHGNMSQNARDKVMNSFRNGTVEILVATDVAGRGIDVNDIEAVFNYDVPRDDEDYIHRIGRTARAGKSGLAFTFITGKQMYNLKRIEKINGIEIHRENVPTINEVELSKISAYSSKVAEIIEAGHLSKYINQIEILMDEEYTSLDVAAALLKIALDKESEALHHTVHFEETPERSRQSGRNFSGHPYNRPYDKPDYFKKKQGKESMGKSIKEFNYDKTQSGRKEESTRSDRPFRQKDNTQSARKEESIGSDRPFRQKDNTQSTRKEESTGSDRPFRQKDNTQSTRKEESTRSDRPFRQKDKTRHSSLKNVGKPFKEKYGKENSDQKRSPKKFGKNK